MSSRNGIGTTDDDLPDLLAASNRIAKGEPPILKMVSSDPAPSPSDWLQLWRPGTPVGVGLWDMPEDVYHSQDTLDRPALSSGAARRLIHQSPLHTWHEHPKLGAQHEEDSTPEQDGGTVVHKLLLGKGRDLVVCDYGDWRTNAAKAERDAAREVGRVPVLKHKFIEYGEMVTAVEKQIRTSEAKAFYSPTAVSEVVGIAEMGGVLCQALFDRLSVAGAQIFDLKCTSSVHPKAISKKIAEMGYHVQAALYKRVLEALFPALAGRVDFTFIFVENTPPYVMAPYALSGEFEAIGNSMVDRALSKWRDCLDADEWPGYPRTVTQVEPPAWLMYDEQAAAYTP